MFNVTVVFFCSIVPTSEFLRFFYHKNIILYYCVLYDRFLWHWISQPTLRHLHVHCIYIYTPGLCSSRVKHINIKQMDQTQILPLSIVFSKLNINIYIILNIVQLYKYTYIISIKVWKEKKRKVIRHGLEPTLGECSNNYTTNTVVDTITSRTIEYIITYFVAICSFLHVQ